MHDTAHDIAQQFFDVYVTGERPAILEIGSQIFNGTVRDCAPSAADYVGVDISAGSGVDVVLDDPYVLPFQDGRFDAVISSSCFEHDQMFWLTFLEMVRVTKDGGRIYINVPSNGVYHSYPFDNWRFYPDSGLALLTWAKRQGHELVLLESFIARRRADDWNDCVLIFGKGAEEQEEPVQRVADRLPAPYNVRRNGDGAVDHLTGDTEDMLLLKEARGERDTREQDLARLRTVLASLEGTFAFFAGKISDAMSDRDGEGEAPGRGGPAGSQPDPVEPGNYLAEMANLGKLAKRVGPIEAELATLRSTQASHEAVLASLGDTAEKQHAGVAEALARAQQDLKSVREQLDAFSTTALGRFEAADAAAAGLRELIESRASGADSRLEKVEAQLAEDRARGSDAARQSEERLVATEGELARLAGALGERDRRIETLEAALSQQQKAGEDALAAVQHDLDVRLRELADHIGPIHVALSEQQKASDEALAAAQRELGARLNEIADRFGPIYVAIDNANAGIEDIHQIAEERVFPALRSHSAALRPFGRLRRLFTQSGDKQQPKAGVSAPQPQRAD